MRLLKMIQCRQQILEVVSLTHTKVSVALCTIANNRSVKFNSGIKAKVNIGITTLTMMWKQQWICNEIPGLNSVIEMKVGDVGAKVNIWVQLYGETGKLKPRFEVHVKAEVAAAKLKGTVGANISGRIVRVNGTVGVGIGAHMDIVYKGGVFTADVGVYAGVGTSIGIETNIGR